MNFQEVMLSECCVEYRFGEEIAERTSEAVLGVYHALSQNAGLKKLGIRDIVPTYTTVAVHFEPSSPLFDETAPLRRAVDEAAAIGACPQGKVHRIDVAYCGEDVEAVCEATGLARETLVALHSEKEYRIAMLGFRPYFPYLLGLDERLQLPRRENPRKQVRKGAVAIAGMQTGIYPEASPGGWHIIGYTDFERYSELLPGERIVFRSRPC